MKQVLAVKNKRHGEALLRWRGLDPTVWDLVLFGTIVNRTYTAGLVARPISEVTEADIYWVFEILRPRVVGVLHAMAPWVLVRPQLLLPAPKEAQSIENPLASWS